MDTGELLLRLTLSFFILFILTRIMGRKEISQLTFFNFVSAISIGAIAAELAINENMTVTHGLIALITWTIFTLLMAFIDIKSKKARKFTTGSPVIVINKGKIVEQALRKTQLDLDSLKALLRKKDVFHISDVDYAIFETNGELTVLKHYQYQYTTKKDLEKHHVKQVDPLSTELINDGKVNTDHLAKLGLSKEWLMSRLQEFDNPNIEDIFYAELTSEGTLYVDYKKNH